MRKFCSLATLLIALLAGCGESGPEVVPVSGTLMRNGQPVPHLDVNFQPVEGRPSYGETDANGQFTLRYTRDQDGARVGKHTVWVVWKQRSPEDEFAGVRPSSQQIEVLEKYGSQQTTPLREVEISEPTENLVIHLD